MINRFYLNLLFEMFKSKSLFDDWNNVKQNLHNIPQDEIFVNPRDVQYVKIGINVGYEQNGKKYFICRKDLISRFNRISKNKKQTTKFDLLGCCLIHSEGENPIARTFVF